MRRRQAICRFVVIAATAVTPAARGGLPAAAQAARSAGLYAELHTSKGVIIVELEPDRTPLAVANFVGLAEGTILNDAFPPGTPFFDGTVFHRVVPGHAIQAGAPASDAARGAGYVFPNEVHPELGHGRAGMLGVANGGPHTNGNQFYITLGDRSYLDGDYIVFGAVIEGLDVAFDIRQGDVIDTVRVVRVGAAAQRYHPDTDSFGALVAAAEQRAARQERARLERVRDTIAARWPAAVATSDGRHELIERQGSGEPAAAGATIVARYRGETLRGTAFRSLADGSPAAGAAAQEFALAPGDRAATTGLDRALRDMRPGERRLVIVPSELGYGSGGFYAPEVRGEPRFVLRPVSTLVYDVELIEVR